MKRGVSSELSLRGEIEHALQYIRPPLSRYWTVAQLAEETSSTAAEVDQALEGLKEEGFVTRHAHGVVRWN